MEAMCQKFQKFEQTGVKPHISKCSLCLIVSMMNSSIH